VIDQDRDGLAQIGRRLALRQQHVLAVEVRKRDAVAGQVRRRHHAVGCKLAVERREIEADVGPIGLGHPQRQRMRLLLRPMRQVARADVAREYLRSGHLRSPVDAIFQDAIAAVPIRPAQQSFFEQRCKGPAAQRSEVNRDAADQARAQELPARRAQAIHDDAPGLRLIFASWLAVGWRREAAAPQTISDRATQNPSISSQE